jgi:predicted lactoylglutathione lyase
MSTTEILIKLRELHDELSGINDGLHSAQMVDEETIDALGQLATEVNELIEQSRESGGRKPDELQRQDLMDRIQRFQSQHSRVNRFLLQMTDILVLMSL